MKIKTSRLKLNKYNLNKVKPKMILVLSKINKYLKYITVSINKIFVWLFSNGL